MGEQNYGVYQSSGPSLRKSHSSAVHSVSQERKHTADVRALPQGEEERSQMKDLRGTGASVWQLCDTRHTFGGAHSPSPAFDHDSLNHEASCSGVTSLQSGSAGVTQERKRAAADSVPARALSVYRQQRALLHCKAQGSPTISRICTLEAFRLADFTKTLLGLLDDAVERKAETAHAWQYKVKHHSTKMTQTFSYELVDLGGYELLNSVSFPSHQSKNRKVEVDASGEEELHADLVESILLPHFLHARDGAKELTFTRRRFTAPSSESAMPLHSDIETEDDRRTMSRGFRVYRLDCRSVSVVPVFRPKCPGKLCEPEAVSWQEKN
ncbi:hypothetical protein DNTS_013832 [Danionella cerebrum]|uniref:Uncharacterized protein n=1 Tax=Danionella cerebrum TaxID=2873325 RepID=A0A553PXV6_9TELE|nr:hypothetical protein DNTS_013832 [Danionella translucida]